MVQTLSDRLLRDTRIRICRRQPGPSLILLGASEVIGLCASRNHLVDYRGGDFGATGILVTRRQPPIFWSMRIQLLFSSDTRLTKLASFLLYSFLVTPRLTGNLIKTKVMESKPSLNVTSKWIVRIYWQVNKQQYILQLPLLQTEIRPK